MYSWIRTSSRVMFPSKNFNRTYALWSLLPGLVIVAYYAIKRQQSYWKRKGVKEVKPKFFVGSVQIYREKPQVFLVQDLYSAFPGKRYHGFYQFLQPTLMLKDLELIAQITKKDFENFQNRRISVSADVDPFWSRTLFASEGERWHDLRTTLSPAFTNNKLTLLYKLIDECVQQFIEYFQNDPADIIEFEVKDTLRRFTNDVIASAAFGEKIDSLRDRKNPFYMMGTTVTDFGRWKVMKFFMNDIIPPLNKLFRVRMISTEVANYFSKVISQNVKTRKEKNIDRPDMIGLLLKKQNERKQVSENESSESKNLENRRRREITLDDIISQAFIFFFAGFETASTFLVFAFYELAANPDVQTKLRQEIDGVEGEITQEKIMSLKYLDQVVCEILRKWPPVTVADRKVTKPYTIPSKTPEEAPLHLEKGIVVWVPIFPIHRDPNYYPDPDRLDPERFNDQNKENTLKAYMPFGQGRRMCLGSRFALLEGKMFMFHVLRNFEIVPTEKSEIPVVLDQDQATLTPKGGLWLGFKKRKTV